MSDTPDEVSTRHVIVWEKCAKALYENLNLFPDVPYEGVDKEVRDSYRRMVAVVFKELFEMDPTEIALLFIDGRPLNGE